MKQIWFITLGVMFALALIIGYSTFNEANQEQLDLTARLQSRTQLLAESLTESIEPPFSSHATSTVQSIVDRISSNEHIAGLAVINSDGGLATASSSIPQQILTDPNISTVMDSDEATGIFTKSGKDDVYVYITPLHFEDRVVGALLVMQDTDYIGDSVSTIWRESLLPLFLQICIFGLAIFVLVRWVFFKPLRNLSESVKAIRRGEAPPKDTKHQAFLEPLSNEITKMTTSLRQARVSAGEEARMRLEKLDTPWTAERLREFIKAYLKDRKVFLVSNLEPFIHTQTKKGIQYQVPASGLITALEPVMEACGGMWIAEASGDADKLTVGEDDTIQVPPDEPKYTLKRVWLSEEEKKDTISVFQ